MPQHFDKAQASQERRKDKLRKMAREGTFLWSELYNAVRMRSRECWTMKNVMYHYNSAEGEEELHEDEEVDKLVKGGVVERNGENWKIVEILATVGVSVPKPLDIVRVYLAGLM
jgi:hypothetical protein